MLFSLYFQTLVRSLFIFIAWNKGCFSKEICFSSSWAVICHNKAEIQVCESWRWHTYPPALYKKHSGFICFHLWLIPDQMPWVFMGTYFFPMCNRSEIHCMWWMVVLVVTGSKPNINHRNAKCISTSTALSKDTDTSENKINLTPEKKNGEEMELIFL